MPRPFARDREILMHYATRNVKYTTVTTNHYKKERRPTALRREKRKEHLDTEGIREKELEKRRKRIGKKQKVKKERKHRREEQGGRKNQPGQGDSAQEQREEEKAATEGEVLLEDA